MNRLNKRFTARTFCVFGLRPEWPKCDDETILDNAFALTALTLIATVVLTFWYVCPCERTPGGPLRYTEVVEPVTNWRFANDVGLCQLEVPGAVPWSINLNCMSADGKLYVSCARCEGKYWSTTAPLIRAARIAIGQKTYPVNLRRITDPAELDQAWQARAAKTGRGSNQPCRALVVVRVGL